MYQIAEIKKMNMEDAFILCRQEYVEECKNNENIPPLDAELEERMREGIAQASNAPYGKALYQGDTLMGFIAFYGPWNGFHGSAKGVFSPLAASAFGGKDRGKVATILLAEVAEELVKEQIFTIAISRYANDEVVNKALCLNSFGIRCSDAMVDLKKYGCANEIVRVLQDDDTDKTLDLSRKVRIDMQVRNVIEELRGKDKWEIRELYEHLANHLAQSPCLFPTRKGQAEKWLSNDQIRVLAARKDGIIIGYMALDDEAETFVTEKAEVSNICGAYVREKYRATGVAKQLLDAMVEMCIKEGRNYLSVDYETVNPTALGFWTKHFSPYTYSFIRRIDERIYQYESE